jgi:precorrin-6B C5,15-methyltransferase / cobalt-precorrin-6B C5,C15-methyltransferase
MITVVGIDERGPGEAASTALRSAALVVGAARHLETVPVPARARTVTLGPVEPALEALRAHAGPGAPPGDTAGPGDAVVLAGGDPGFFGIVRRLRAAGLEPVVEPAVSSVAALAARAGRSWDDALVVSAHGRDTRAAVNACRAHPKVALLTGPDLTPADLGERLSGWERRLVVGENLGLPDERVSEVSPEQARTRAWADLSVVLCLGPGRPAPMGWHAGAAPQHGFALDDDAFEARAAMLTKSEVRAVVLGRLGPHLGGLVWDVGTGSGSVAVEAARLGAAVVAVDRDPEAVALARANADRHGVDVRTEHGAAPEALGTLPDPDQVFVGGGGPEVVRACAARGPGRVVVTLAAPERIGEVRAALRGYRVSGTVLQASRLAGLPDGTDRLAATNPVTVLWGTR